MSLYLISTEFPRIYSTTNNPQPLISPSYLCVKLSRLGTVAMCRVLRAGSAPSGIQDTWAAEVIDVTFIYDS